MTDRKVRLGILATAAILYAALSISTSGQSNGGKNGNGNGVGLDELKRIQRGFEITPVPLNLKGKDQQLVGLGSYIVNAQAACGDCHTCPTYAPGTIHSKAAMVLSTRSIFWQGASRLAPSCRPTLRLMHRGSLRA